MNCASCLNSYVDLESMEINCDKWWHCSGQFYEPIKLENEATEVNKEMVDHPSHYNMGKYEAIDVIEDWQLNFNLGNTIKYISRAGHKDDIVQDLKKALWYLEREIKRLENTK